MNIAITSFIKSENYGALLQSFALQRAIEKLGHKAVYLDYEGNPNFTVIQRLKNTAYRIIRVFLGYHKRKCNYSAIIILSLSSLRIKLG